MRVVIDGIIFQKDPHSGIARLFRELMPRMCDLSPELEISLFIDGPIHSEIPHHPQIHIKNAPAVRIHFRPQGHWRQIAFPFRRVGSRFWNFSRQIWLGKGQDEIWHSTFFTFLPGWRSPEIVTVHDMAPERFKEIFSDPMDAAGRDQKKRCIERAVEIICDSCATKIDLEAEYQLGEKKISVIPLSHSKVFQIFHDDQSADFDFLIRPFLLYVGSRAHYKNFRFLLDVYANWVQREQIHLAVVGPAWTAEEKRVIDALGLKDLVHNTGHVSDIVLCQALQFSSSIGFPIHCRRIWAASSGSNGLRMSHCCIENPEHDRSGC